MSVGPYSISALRDSHFAISRPKNPAHIAPRRRLPATNLVAIVAGECYAGTMAERLDDIKTIAPVAAVTALVSRVFAGADETAAQTSHQAAREVYHNIAANIAR